MRSIKDILIEKLDINKVSLDKFPIDGNPVDIAKFLEKYNFEEVLDSYDYESVNDTLIALSKCRNKCYMLDIDTDRWIRICDTTKEKISKNNPCVFISYETKNYDLESPHSDDIHLSKEECLKYLKKKFSIG